MTKQKDSIKDNTYKFKCVLCGDEFEKEHQLFYHYQYECDGGW